MITLKLEVDIAVVDLNPGVDRGHFQMLVRRGDQRQQVGEMHGPAHTFDRAKQRGEIELIG